MQTKRENFITQRGQMAFVGIVLWFLLAAWSLSAFWQHVDELGAAYPKVTKLGAMAGEVALAALIWWHCFNKHMNVRRWSLIFSIILAAAILVHAGALRGMREAQTAQANAEDRLEEKLTKMSKEQMGATRRKADVAKAAQKELADTVRAGNDKIKDSSILPRWYLDGWMYSVLFILSLGFVGAAFWMMMNREDIDANFDGVPDRLQEPREYFDSVVEVPVTGRLEQPEGKGFRQ